MTERVASDPAVLVVFCRYQLDLKFPSGLSFPLTN